MSQDNDGKSVHYDFFGQDQWKLSDRLSLSYGLRYEIHPGYHDVHGDIGNFDPSYGRSRVRSIYPTGFSNLLATDFLASANACEPYGTTTGGSTINGAPCMPVLSNSQAGYPKGLKHYPHLALHAALRLCLSSPLTTTRRRSAAASAMYNINMLGNSFYSLTGTLQAATTQYTNSLDRRRAGLPVAGNLRGRPGTAEAPPITGRTISAPPTAPTGKTRIPSNGR